jgi:hypothetical protein
VGGDGDQGVAEVQLGVGESAVLPAGDHRDRPGRTLLEQRQGRIARPQNPPFGRPLPGCERRGEHAVRDGLLQGIEELDAGHQIGGVMSDPLDPVGVEHLRLDQAHLLDPEVLRNPNRTGDVDDVLRIDEDEYGGTWQRGNVGTCK